MFFCRNIISLEFGQVRQFEYKIELQRSVLLRHWNVCLDVRVELSKWFSQKTIKVVLDLHISPKIAGKLTSPENDRLSSSSDSHEFYVVQWMPYLWNLRHKFMGLHQIMSLESHAQWIRFESQQTDHFIGLMPLSDWSKKIL